MSYEFYIIVHISSLFALFTSSVLAPLCFHSLKRFKKWVFSVHGLSVLLSFVSGFGLIAKANILLQLHHSLVGYGIGIALLTLWLTLLFVRSSLTSLIGFMVLLYMVCISPLLWVQPFWLGVKMSAWITIVISPVIWKKLSFRQDYFYLQYFFLIAIATLAIASVILKP